ncbi:MAG: hypothetical protein R3E89_00745 [Thiolinea sp.]
MDLDEGFQQARTLMDQAIRQAVYRDIGGDQQRISSLNTHHSGTTFKHILLPVWSAAFRYQGQTYRFVINGRNGRTQGERPYSKIKIALLVISILALLAVAAYYLESSGLLEQMMYQLDSPSYPPSGYYYR